MAIFVRSSRTQPPVLVDNPKEPHHTESPLYSAELYVKDSSRPKSPSMSSASMSSASLEATPESRRGHLRQAARRGAAEFARRFRTAVKNERPQPMPAIPASPPPQHNLPQGANTLELGSGEPPCAAELRPGASPEPAQRSPAARWDSIVRRNDAMAKLNPQTGHAHVVKREAYANANLYVPLAFKEHPNFETQAFAGPAEGMDVEAQELTVFSETPTNSSLDSTVSTSLGSSGFVEQLAQALHKTNQFDPIGREELAMPDSVATDFHDFVYQDAVPAALPQVKGE
jgi:hypothetical protein